MGIYSRPQVVGMKHTAQNEEDWVTFSSLASIALINRIKLKQL